MSKSTLLKRAPESAFVPQDDDAIKRIAASMKDHGFNPMFPILVKTNPETGKDEIIDGWHRYLAARDAEVEPEFKNIENSNLGGLSIFDYCAMANLTRRQLASTKYCLSVLKLAKLSNGDKQPSVDDQIMLLMKHTQASPSTCAKAVKMVGVLTENELAAVLENKMTIAAAEAKMKEKTGSKASGTRAPTQSPPMLDSLRTANMVQCKALEKISWVETWRRAVDHYHEHVQSKHRQASESA